MMSPPDQRAERELVRAGEIFGTIKILIREILQMLAFYQLMEVGIEIGRDDERQTCQLILQCAMRRLKHGSYFGRDRSLFPKELCIGQQHGFVIGKLHRMGYHDMGGDGMLVFALSSKLRNDTEGRLAASSNYLWRVSNDSTVSS